MGKTITTHLLDGTPNGVQEIQIGNKTIIAYVIPRSKVKAINEISELSYSSLYMLYEQETKEVYVGHTDNFLKRIVHHDKNKPFWEHVIVFTTQADVLNKSDISYLEYLAIDSIKSSSLFTYDSKNTQIPNRQKLMRYQEDMMNEYFEDVQFITQFVGLDIFKRKIEESDRHYFYAKGKKVNAKGFYDSNSFIVLSGSEVSETVTPSYKRPTNREILIEEHAEKKDTKIVLNEDIIFGSPSTGASFVFGSSRNGWDIWKNEEGKTLDEVYRK